MTPMLLAINLVRFLILKLDKKVSLFNGILWFSGFLWDWLIPAEVKQPSGEAPFRKSLLSPSAGVVDAPQDFVSAWLSLSFLAPCHCFRSQEWGGNKPRLSVAPRLHFFPPQNKSKYAVELSSTLIKSRFPKGENQRQWTKELPCWAFLSHNW